MKGITDISDAVAIASGSQTIAVSVIPPRHYLRQCREVLPCDAHFILQYTYGKSPTWDPAFKTLIL